MKKLTAMLILFAGLLTSSLHATVYENDSGPYTGTSFSSNWVSLAGYNITTPVGGVYVSFDDSVIQVGRGSGNYTAKVTVFDYTSNTTYSTTSVFLGGAGSNGHQNLFCPTPMNHYCNVTIWIQSGQSFSNSDYCKVTIKNIVISS